MASPQPNLSYVTNVVESGKTNAWMFDAYDRVSSYRDSEGNLLQYRHDPNGSLTHLVYPGGRNVFYAYDRLNRLTNVTDWAGRQTRLTFDLAGRITAITRPNGTVRELSYDAAGQLTNLVERTGSGLPIAVFRFQWDGAGRMESEFAAPLPQPFTPPARVMTHDADNRLATCNGQGVMHDLDGNLTYGPGTNSTFLSYAYDARNRLLGAGGLGYGYDALGNRTSVTNGANVTRFAINPNAALSEVLVRTRPDGSRTFYVHGPGLLYEVNESAGGVETGTATYHYDYRGSTAALTDGGGLVTDRIEYSPYGLTIHRAGTNDTPFLFNGRYGVQTDANGLLHMRARYYNPYLGRFLNADPVGFDGGLNFYAYADGNPISLIDPFGLYGNPVSGADGPVGRSSPYALGGAFYVPSPVQPSPASYFVGGVVVGAGVAAAVVLAAPVAVSGLVAVGVPATTASAAVTTGVGVAAVGGAVATGMNTYYAVQANDWNAVAFNAGGVVGGLAVGVGGGGRAMAGGIMGRPSPGPNTWNPITLAQYEWSARLRLDYPDGSIPNWMASAPTPASGGASAAFAAGGVSSFLPTFGTPNSRQSQGSWITASFGFGSSSRSSSTGK